MNKRIAIITSACLIIPVLITAVWYTISFIGELNYVDLEKSVDYYSVITNNINPVIPNEQKYIDEKLDAELAKHRYSSMSRENAISVLKEIRKIDYHCFNIVLGNGELVYMNDRKFSNAYVIITPENTYLLAWYRVRDPDDEFSLLRTEYTMYLMNNGSINSDDFSYLEETERDLLSVMIRHTSTDVKIDFKRHIFMRIVLTAMFILGTISAIQEIGRKINEKRSRVNH